MAIYTKLVLSPESYFLSTVITIDYLSLSRNLLLEVAFRFDSTVRQHTLQNVWISLAGSGSCVSRHYTQKFS